MTCPRCQGLMVEDDVFDPIEEAISHITVMRCLLCGEILDAVVIYNRTHPLPEKPFSGARGMRATTLAAIINTEQ